MNIGFLIIPSKDFSSKKPFKNERENIFLKKFSIVGKKNGFNVISCCYKDYCNKKIKRAWIFDKNWKKAYNKKIDLIYLYFRFNTKGNKNKKQMKKLKLINNPYLDEIGWDKYLTYKIFMKYMPDSFLVNNKQELEKAVEKIKTEKVVLKPRHGSRGWHIKVIDKKDLPDKIEKNTLAMEFIDTSKGIKSLGIKKRHDFRVLIVDGKIDHCYVRIPKKGSFLANCAKGASKIFIANDKIPKEVVKIVKKVDDRFKKYKPRVYTIDFLFDKGKKPYLIEFNSQPGAFYYDNHEEIRARYFENIFKAIKDYLKNK